MSYQFIPVVIGVAAASYYIESIKKKSRKKQNKIEIPANPIKLVDKPNEIKKENSDIK